MEEKVLVLAYPGSGKTYLAENFENVSDLEFQHFRWDYGKYKTLPLEQLKGIEEKTVKPEWPDNFFKYLEDVLRGGIVLVPMATSLFPILEHLEKQGTRIIFAIPDKDCLDDVVEIYRKRGNREKFIEDRKNDFQKFHNLTAQSKYEKAYIHKNQHLYDALVDKDVKFVKGKGFKNYY